MPDLTPLVTQALDADELIVDVQFSPDVKSSEDMLASMEAIRAFVGQS